MTSFSTITLSPSVDINLTLTGPLCSDAVHLVADEKSLPGGKGLNVAKVLATHGCDVTAGGLLGFDNADLFEQELARLKIRDRFVRIPGMTRNNIMIHDGKAEYKINRRAFPNLDYETSLINGVVSQAVGQASVVILNGSLPYRFPDTTYEHIITPLKAMRRTVVFDSSGEALRHGIAATPHIIKPNRVECGYLLGETLSTPEDMVRACERLAPHHEVVILSDGPRGCYFASCGEVYHVTVPDIPIIDTTAAGDMLLAEFCFRYFPNRQLTHEVMTYATAMGVAAVECLGCECPCLERVEGIVGEMRVERKN